MNKRCMILSTVAATILALTSGAKAYTIERVAPSSESVFMLEGDGIFHLTARVSGLIWPYIWHEADWYWDGQLVSADSGLSGQSAESRGEFPRNSPGTHEVKVRAKYDSAPFGVHVWTSYLTWTVTIVDREAYTIERVNPLESSCSTPVHVYPQLEARFGGIPSPATWDEAQWYVDGVFEKTEALSGQTAQSFCFHTFDTVGTYEVKVRAQYSLGGETVWTSYLTWTVEVIPHPPTASRVSPGSPVTVQAGDTQAFTVRGSDPGSGMDGLNIAFVRWYLDGVQQGDFEVGPQPVHETIEHTWSHTFDSGGTHQVEAVCYDTDGYSSGSGQAAWTVVVPQQAHNPSGTIVSPSSPVTVNMGVPVTFTLQGADPADDLWLCEVSLNGVFQTNSYFSGSSSGSTATWTHTFNTPGTYQVAFAPLDSANNYGATEVWTVVVKAASGQAGLNILVIQLDAQGRAQGPLAGAKVDLTGPGAGTATTDGQGQSAFAGLNPGTYTASVSKTGYYAQSRSVSLAAGETKDEVFRMAPQSPEPAAFDFTSPSGKYLIEGIADLSFSAIVAWNGSPGSVRFVVGAVAYPAIVTDLGDGRALAEVTLPSQGSVAECDEVSVEAMNMDGRKAIVSTGVFLYNLRMASDWGLPGLLLSPAWEPSGGTFYYKVDGSYTFWDTSTWNSPLSIKAGVGFQEQWTYDPFAGTVSKSRGGSGKISMTAKLPWFDVLGEGRVDLSETRVVSLVRCDRPVIKSSWTLSYTGKTGIQAPVVSVIKVVFPPATAAVTAVEKTPVVGDLVKALKFRLYLITGGALTGTYEPDEPVACFLETTSVTGSITVGIEGQVLIAVKKWGWNLEAGVYAGGTGTPRFELCPTPAFKGVTLRAYAGVFATAWSFRLSQEVGMTIEIAPGGQQKVVALAALSGSDLDGGWQPIGDSCLRWGVMNVLADEGSSGGRLRVLSVQGESSQETRLVENVAPLASPVLLSGPSERLILFSLHDPNKPWYAATDIGTLRQIEDHPWGLDRITDDQAAEFGPSIVVADSGTAIAAWERVSGDISDANEPSQVAPHMEIVASWFDPGTGSWSTPQQLTSNEMADHQPMPIAFGATRGILWIAGDASAAVGDANSSSRLMFVKWLGNAWGEPQALWSAQKGIVGFAFVADGLSEGHVVLAVDEDRDPNTTADCELYLLSTANGAWQTATRLTDDSVEDAMPTLVAPNGVPMCVWSADGTLVYSPLRDWNPREVYREYTLANEAPSLDGVTMPGGAAIAYTVQGPNGVDIVAAFYDADLDSWSLPRQLTGDESAETALSLACDANELVIAYLKTQTLRTGMDVEIEGQMHHLENVPQPGRTDLYVLRHTLANDLAVVSESMVVEPANPAPGTTATVRATIESRGDLPLQNVIAVFYDGDPSNGGVRVGDRQVLSGTLIAGGKQNLSVSWKVPQNQSSHELFVVADPCLAVEDRDRSNNAFSVRTVLPDLAIETCRSTEVSSTSMALTARVVNTGVIPAGAFDVSWRLGAPGGEEIGTSTIQSLIGGGAYEATFTWDTAGHLDGGQHAQVFAVADSTRAVPEFDETNNVSSLAVFHPPKSAP